MKNIVEPQERTRKKCLREILNAIFYISKSGCQWRILPSDFAPRQTVYYYFRKWKLEGVLEKILNVLHCMARKSVGRQENSSLVIIDSRSVKTSH
ncbi:MAG: transposase [Bacteroidaceae bacterium]|nr:transposase [Bacteroidaceae bacterium]